MFSYLFKSLDGLVLPVVVPEELYTHEDEGDQELVRVLPHVLPQIAEKEFLSE